MSPTAQGRMDSRIKARHSSLPHRRWFTFIARQCTTTATAPLLRPLARLFVVKLGALRDK